jgi:hypothetical protein
MERSLNNEGEGEKEAEGIKEKIHKWGNILMA